MIEQSEGRFRCSIAGVGRSLEQFEQYAPNSSTCSSASPTPAPWNLWHSHTHILLASLTDPEEFAAQMGDTAHMLRNRFGVRQSRTQHRAYLRRRPRAPAPCLGFKGVLTEGAKHILGWKSPDYVYTAASAPSLKMLLRNSKLSDDIAFRFSDTS